MKLAEIKNIELNNLTADQLVILIKDLESKPAPKSFKTMTNRNNQKSTFYNMLKNIDVMLYLNTKNIELSELDNEDLEEFKELLEEQK